ncbi:hypothetical protein VPBG_00209 [Vibrio phage helene 12B3]|uniref:hypothetical protein n=1 Tax=Vibrio phage helene 12B3 TaxID=573173 RepID=UPI0002C0C03C|nr:hypothetical protein VPBG_00209 [Vibrio phage helene 12B3]AGG57981.1 hypothetical protein VPBG_00209 [Vibrio phage helene 12B3]
MFTSLETAGNITLLNKVLQNTFKEFDGKVENRNAYVEDGKLVRWIDSPAGAPIKKVLRECSDKEVAIWEGYKTLVAALHMEEEEV